MATRSRRMPAQDWENHKEKIIDLFNRKPLKDVRTEMLNLHHFNASKSQYEAQLKQWGVRKNVKRREWAAFFREEPDRDVSTVGAIRTPAGFKSKASIERARRWYNCDCSTSDHASAAGPSISGDAPYDSSPPCTELVLLERSQTTDLLPESQSSWDFIQPLPVTPMGMGVLLETSNPFTFETTGDTPDFMITDDDGFPLMTERTLGHPMQPDVQAQELPILTVIPFRLARSEQWFSSLPSSKLEEALHLGRMNVTSHGSRNYDLSRSLANEFTMSFLAATFYREQQPCENQILNLQGRLQRLNALIPHRNVESTAAIQFSEMNFIRLFLFAMINGFAELDHLPLSQILELLRHSGGLRSLLPLILEAAPHTSSAFAENMFRAAIEASDKDVLELVLKHGRVDKDTIVCFVDGQKFSPIARAASLEAYSIIRALLQYDFFEPKLCDFGTTCVDALGQLVAAGTEWYDGTPGSRVPATSELVDTVNCLIKAGAKARSETLFRALRGFTTFDAAYEVSFGVKQSEHEHFFRLNEAAPQAEAMTYCPILELVMRGADEASAGIIRNMIALCEQDRRCNCLIKHATAVEHAIFQAARRGLHQVVRVLIGYIPSLRKAFCGAIMSRDPELIELLINHGAELDPPACNLIPGPKNSSVLPATPLAEAVKSGNQELTKRLERAGAPTSLFEGNRFEPLVTAVAATGDIAYVRKLLTLCSSSIGGGCRPPSTALSLAIQHDHPAIVQMLLDSGCTGEATFCFSNGEVGQEERKSPLQAVLERRDAELVHIILESNATLQYSPYMETREFEEAACFGDLTVLSDLVCMFPQAALGASGLRQLCKDCMRSNNVNSFRRFLEVYRYRHRELTSQGLSACLLLAIELGHTDMIECLISAGVDPFDRNSVRTVFKSARSNQQNLLRLLSRKPNALRTPPSRITAFGLAPILTEAPGNAEILDDLLQRGAIDLQAIDRCYDQEGRFNQQATPLGLAIVGETRQHQPCLRAIGSLLRAGSDPNGIARVLITEGDVFKPSQTGLMLAIGTGSEAVVKLFIEYGSDLNKKPFLSVKQSPLQCAAERGQLNIVRLLLEHGAKVNGEPARCGGGTALQYAAISGNCNIVAELVDHGAELHALPSKVDGRWPLEGAAEHGRQDMIQFLWNIAGTYISEAPPGAHPFRDVMDIPGFETRQCLRAMKFARDNNYMGCALFVSKLSGVSLDRLNTDEYGVPWLAY